MFKTTLYILLACASPIVATAQKKYAQNIKGTNLSFEMVEIPGGKFVMGNAQGAADEHPEHEVQISPFWMSTLEVTWDIYEPFISKNLEKILSPDVSPEVDAITRPSKPYLDMTFGMGKLGKPAVGMTQYNAIQFCKWLYAKTGVFYRLPTEAEWEYVAKTGMTNDPLEEVAWFEDNSSNSSQNVGSKKPNKYGIYDLLGNAAEWTQDQYEANFYANSSKVDPLNKATKLYPHSVRGGSYLSPKEDLTPTRRDYSDPSWKQIDPQIPKSDWWVPDAPFVGIRLVRPAKTPSIEEINAYYNQAPIKDY